MGYDIQMVEISKKAGGNSEILKRYTWLGWGQICLQLDNLHSNVRINRVSSGSEVSARKWYATSPEAESVDCWDWKSVKKHTARLKRAFSKIA